MVRDKFLFVESEDEWKKTGAFCIRFYDGGKDTVVIVDDTLPMYYSNHPLFAKCKDSNEIWVPMLEKAYAKKYGDYSSIEGGLVHVALAELTNGAPKSISLSSGN